MQDVGLKYQAKGRGNLGINIGRRDLELAYSHGIVYTTLMLLHAKNVTPDSTNYFL